ncbi:MAG: carboxypeptidase-like regulatory domain-containing protein, partial [Terracidiphilus sp.]
VRNADGDALESVEVEAVPADDSEGGGGSAVTDERGHYEIRSLDAGRYFVGLRIADQAAGKAGVYAPGVKDRKRALTVTLGQAERRGGVNIRVPAEAGD